MAESVVLLSIPQLRHKDVTPGGLASLERLEGKGALAELIPAFPGLAASSFATLITGTGPYEHGLIGNTYYDRAERRIIRPPLPDFAIQAPRVWQKLQEVRPGARTMLWFAPNARGADVEIEAWIRRDWTLATVPPALAADLVGRFGAYPRPAASGSGEPPRLEATAWMLKTASAMIAAEAPDLAIVRVPYLGQVARRFGPDGREAGRAIRELESVLAPFLASLPKTTTVLAVTESVTTPVSGPVYPNVVLRGLGLLTMEPAPGGGVTVDLEKSAAFALADHQLCHIYLNDPNQAATVAAVFAGPHSDGIATVTSCDRRATLGMDHPRAGDVILVAQPDRWFSPDWWSSPGDRPLDAEGRTLLTAATPGTPLDPAHVKGSLGAPPPSPDYLGVVVSSEASAIGDLPQISARDITPLVLKLLSSATVPALPK